MNNNAARNQLFHVGILCDGTPDAGMGHLVRCASLSRALEKAGAKVSFWLLEGSDRQLADAQGVTGHILAGDPNNPDEIGTALVDQTKEAIDLLIVDTYRLDDSFYTTLHEACPGMGLIAYDDFGEKAALPLLGVINAGLAASSIPYPGRFSLFSALGPTYATLPRRCLSVQKRSVSSTQDIKRILLVMGGGDPEGQTIRIAKLLDEMRMDIPVEVVLGPMYGTVDDGFKDFGNLFTIHEAPDNFHEIAKQCDLAITGAGTICFEFLYLGIPIATLSLADNQAPMAEALSLNGLGYHLGRFDTVSDTEIKDRIAHMVANPQSLRENADKGMAVVDGNGDERLAGRMIETWRLFTGTGFTLPEVAKEYQAASLSKRNHEKALWGSAEGMRNRFRLALEFIGPGHVTSWLDIGCGTGDFQQEAANIVFPDNFVGLDMCEATLGFARDKNVYGDSSDYYAQDFMDPMPVGPFSLVTAIGVLHKCGHKLYSSIGRLASLVEPGGRVLLTTKNLAWEAFDAPDFFPYGGHAWFWPKQVTTAMKACGFIEIHIRGFEPRSGSWIPLDQGHSMMILATRGGEA